MRNHTHARLAGPRPAVGNGQMNPTEPLRPESDSPRYKSDFRDADRSWALAIGLLKVWRATDKAHWRPIVAQRLAEIAADGGPAAAEQAALGLTKIAGMYLEMYAHRMNASPDEVLQYALDCAVPVASTEVWPDMCRLAGVIAAPPELSPARSR
jgi:hypothetical protein